MKHFRFLLVNLCLSTFVAASTGFGVPLKAEDHRLDGIVAAIRGKDEAAFAKVCADSINVVETQWDTQPKTKFEGDLFDKTSNPLIYRLATMEVDKKDAKAVAKLHKQLRKLATDSFWNETGENRRVGHAAFLVKYGVVFKVASNYYWMFGVEKVGNSYVITDIYADCH